MRFTLTYRGRLPANGTSRDKHEVRKALHTQLKHLFTYPPLDRRRDEMLTEDQTPGRSIIKRLDGYRFAPVVNTMYRQVALIELLFLRPQSPGKLIVSGGDIDNRLKTLFDALRMP